MTLLQCSTLTCICGTPVVCHTSLIDDTCTMYFMSAMCATCVMYYTSVFAGKFKKTIQM